LSASSFEKEFEKEMLSPGSPLTDLSPPSKKRRISYSSSSNDDSDEEDKPLAALAQRQNRANGVAHKGRGTKQRSGKGVKKAKGTTAPVSLPPPTEEEQRAMNDRSTGVNGQETKIKVEDAMDGSQLDRLATGVTVDTAGSGTLAVRRSSY
jgi:histone acetyltransferase